MKRSRTPSDTGEAPDVAPPALKKARNSDSGKSSTQVPKKPDATKYDLKPASKRTGATRKAPPLVGSVAPLDGHHLVADKESSDSTVANLKKRGRSSSFLDLDEGETKYPVAKKLRHPTNISPEGMPTSPIPPLIYYDTFLS